MAYGTAESFPGVYVFCIDIMNNLTILAGKPRKQIHLIIVREKHLLHKVSGGSRISHGGGHWPHGGHQLPRWLCFNKFVCQNERIWTLRGCTPVVPSLDPPMKVLQEKGS